MALSHIAELPPSTLAAFPVIAVFVALVLRVFYNLYLHPLAKYHGPWYAASFSLCSALISILRVEPQWMYYLTKRYGSESLPLVPCYPLTGMLNSLTDVVLA